MDESTPPPPPAPNVDPQSAAAAPPPAVPLNPPAESTGLAPNVAAGLCAALPLVGGAVFLFLEKQNPFVRFWAMQSVFFGAALFVVSIVLQIAGLVLGHIPILGWLLLLVLALAGLVFGLGSFVVWVITIVKAFSNVEWEIPYIGKLARKQLAGEKLF
jgi:uncharacterized membrane protein